MSDMHAEKGFFSTLHLTEMPPPPNNCNSPPAPIKILHYRDRNIHTGKCFGRQQRCEMNHIIFVGNTNNIRWDGNELELFLSSAWSWCYFNYGSPQCAGWPFHCVNGAIWILEGMSEFLLASSTEMNEKVFEDKEVLCAHWSSYHCWNEKK